MANSLKHVSVGTSLSQTEWEAIDGHAIESQATGDIIYAYSSSSLRRLAVGTNTHVLVLDSGVPVWSSSTGITALGTIATGVWQGTDVGVAYGGTGVSTLTDGGVLLGSGTNAITAMAVLTDGQMIVGNGSTDPVAESGATLRTSIGVGTGDSPQFTDLTLTDDLVLNSDSAVFSMGDGADFSITHDGTTGASIAGNPLVLTMTDNTDPALSVKEGSNEYMVFDTTNGTEGIGIGRGPTTTSRLLVDWPAMSTSVTGTYIKSNFRGNNGAVTMGDDMTTMATVGIHEPNVTVNGNTLTNAASLYIGSVATEASFNHAIIVDAGTNRFDDSVFIGDNANAANTLGLTINQGAADNEVLSLKSSDVNTGMTNGFVATEVDTYFSVGKMSGTYGGAFLIANCEDEAQSRVMGFGVVGGTADTTKTTSANGLVDWYITEQNGSNGLANITANGNIFAIRARVGGNTIARWVVDEDGDVYSPTTNAHIAFSDSYDDAQLIRAFDHAKSEAGQKGMIREKWDDFIKYNEDDLIEAGVLGDTMENGGLLNTSALQRLHNGAIWQGYVRQQELQERVEELETKLLALEGAK
jgi:hypothetical protein